MQCFIQSCNPGRPIGAVSGGADTKRRYKNFDDLFLPISPISSQPSHSFLRLHSPSSVPFLTRSHKRNQNLIVLLSPLRPPGDQYNLFQSAKKKFSQISPGAQRFARGALSPGEWLNETLDGRQPDNEDCIRLDY
jgi:hypothetical protein